MREIQIHEAVKNAIENDRCITLPEFLGTSKIKPTNGPGHCIVMRADGWQPSAEELLRSDWEVVD